MADQGWGVLPRLATRLCRSPLLEELDDGDEVLGEDLAHVGDLLLHRAHERAPLPHTAAQSKDGYSQPGQEPLTPKPLKFVGGRKKILKLHLPPRRFGARTKRGA